MVGEANRVRSQWTDGITLEVPLGPGARALAQIGHQGTVVGQLENGAGQVVGILDYHADGDTLVLPHTVIDASERGQGLGATLVQFALDEIRRDGQRIVPTCSFVAQFLDEHPQYQDLIAA